MQVKDCRPVVLSEEGVNVATCAMMIAKVRKNESDDEQKMGKTPEKEAGHNKLNISVSVRFQKNVNYSISKMNRKYTLILCICMVSFFGEILGAGTHQKLYMNTNNDPQLGEPGSKSMYNKIYMTQNTYHLDVDEDVAKLPLKDNGKVIIPLYLVCRTSY